ncbi:MAG: tRNA-specific 2-thiouridylase MnmA [Nitrospirales bacterium]|nr:MAG: tRNA-specific 2-thiouridylase MnmA [Nitrospirales bacterium]
MSNQPTVVLGMSGGVDSSVAASILVEQGYDVRGVTLQVWEDETEETRTSKRWEERGCCKVGIARHVAQLLNIPHQVIDTQEIFQKGVIDDFTQAYLSGETPNPCVRCNERVKFGSLYKHAQALGADFVATGHYARIGKKLNGRLQLGIAEDRKKDQSYFLYRISPDWLPHILFPVGQLQKSEVWNRAEAMGLPTDELKESQEICFVTQGNYREFLKVNAPESMKPGTFVDMQGSPIGQHDGIAFYTSGQRKGLGLATGERLYVHHVIPESNTVVLGAAEDLDTWTCRISELNIFSQEHLTEGAHILAKCRYATSPVMTTVTWDQDDTMVLKFKNPQRSLSPGQSVVFYDDAGWVLGGGIIQREQELIQVHSQNSASVLQGS